MPQWQPRTLVLLSAVAVGVLGAPAGTALAAVPSNPWGPRQVLYADHSAETISQATTTGGVTVVTFRTKPRHAPAETRVAIQVRGQRWSSSAPLSTGKALRPTVIAWGTGHLSVIYQSSAGRDDYLFHERTLKADGTLGPARKLFTAKYAYPSYQAAVNSAGDIALAWSNGDLFDRVVVVDRDGNATELPVVPVHHPTEGGYQFIANPRALFLDDAGRVSDLTWGTLNGSDRAIWLMRPDGSDGWRSQRVAPVAGGTLGYGYVHQADYAANTRGDLAVSWEQRDPTTKQWTAQLRYAPAGAKLGAPKTLGHQYCFIDNPQPCASLAVASDGTTTVAYETTARGNNLQVNVIRRAPEGTFGSPQHVSVPIWVNSFGGVQVAGNPRGDAVVSFTGGTHKIIWSQFARCPAAAACTATLRRENQPSWLDPLVTSIGPKAGTTVTWSQYYHAGVATRHLAP